MGIADRAKKAENCEHCVESYKLKHLKGILERGIQLQKREEKCKTKMGKIQKDELQENENI